MEGGIGTLAIILKQWRSLGVRCFLSPSLALDGFDVIDQRAYTSDGGSDQKKGHDLMFYFLHHTLVILWTFYCIQHRGALGKAGALKICDAFLKKIGRAWKLPASLTRCMGAHGGYNNRGCVPVG